MIKKTTYPDGRVEEISGSPSEIAEYEGKDAFQHLRHPSGAPGLVQDECEKWRRLLEEGVQRGPQCDTMWFTSVDAVEADPVVMTKSATPFWDSVAELAAMRSRIPPERRMPGMRTTCGGWVMPPGA